MFRGQRHADIIAKVFGRFGLASLAALALAACTPLNAPTDASTDTPAGTGGSGNSGTGGAGRGGTSGAAGVTGAGGSPVAGTGGAIAGTTGTAGRGGTGGGSGGTGGAVAGSTGAAGRGGAGGTGGAVAGTTGTAGRGGMGGLGGAGGGGTGSTSECGRFTKGPAMVEARMLTRPICVDATEVTQAQYQQFLTFKNSDTTGQQSECAWNMSYAPVLYCNFDPTGHANYPVNGIDWCDATAFCKWAGKRLCGGPAGANIETAAKTDLADPQKSEWTALCSHNGERGYPYGTVFNPEACNVGEHSGTPRAIVPVGSTTGCEGGFPGIFDMVGNVHEWENACYAAGAATGQDDICWFRGDSYHDTNSSCSTAWDVKRDYVDTWCDIGFRCCADP